MQDRNVYEAGRRRLLAAFAYAGAAAALGPAISRAQSAADTRPIRLILPVGPGSGVDTITRSATPALSAALHQTVVVENMPGAGGIVGTSALVREKPDGHTLGMVSNNHATFPSVYKSVPFDPIGDITPISMIGSTPLLLVINPKRLPANNVQEVIALIKAKPGQYNHASSGNGTILHLAMEMFLWQAGLQARHIPYRGVGPMVTDLISGQVDIGVLSYPSVMPHLQSGALKAVGACGARRSSVLPDLPTIREQGLKDYEVDGWFAMIGPKGLADKDVQRVYQGLQTAFRTEGVKASMAQQGNDITLMPPEKTAAFFVSEAKKYAAIVKAAKLEPQ